MDYFRNVFGDFTDPQARIVMTLIYLQHYWLQASASACPLCSCV